MLGFGFGERGVDGLHAPDGERMIAVHAAPQSLVVAHSRVRKRRERVRAVASRGGQGLVHQSPWADGNS